MIEILEVVDYKWTIKEVLEQPDDWVDDILTFKGVGETFKPKPKGSTHG